MSMMSPQVGARRRIFAGFAHRVHQWFGAARERRRERREMAALSHLPLHLLQDMGLEKYAAPREPVQWRQLP